MAKTIAIISGIPLPLEATAFIHDIALAHNFSVFIMQLAEGTVEGCRSCGKCIKQHKCMFEDVNQILDISDDILGLAILSPFYYGQLASHVKNFLDRLFHSGSDKLSYRCLAAYAYARKHADPTSALDPYISLSKMDLVGEHVTSKASDYTELYALIEMLCNAAESHAIPSEPTKRDFSFLR